MLKHFPCADDTKAFYAADLAWERELWRHFGVAAAAARHQVRGRGEVGSRLRALYDARQAAQARWQQRLDRVLNTLDTHDRLVL